MQQRRGLTVLMISHDMAVVQSFCERIASVRLRLLKLGARVIETLSRVRLALASACHEAKLFRTVANTLLPAGP